MQKVFLIKLIVLFFSTFFTWNCLALSPDDCKKIIPDIYSDIGKKQWMSCLLSDDFDMNKNSENEAKKIEEFKLKYESEKALIEKETKGPIQSFSVREFNLGDDYLPILKEKLGFIEGGENVDGFPDVRKEFTDANTSLYFYRNILFMITFKDLQDTLEIRDAMNQIEAKFKNKFVQSKPKTTRFENIENIENSFLMNIGNYGIAKVELSTTKPISRQVCLDDIAREIRTNIRLGYRNTDSLTDRFESECKLKSNPIRMIFTNKKIEAIVNSRANEEQKVRKTNEEIEKINATLQKAKKF